MPRPVHPRASRAVAALARTLAPLAAGLALAAAPAAAQSPTSPPANPAPTASDARQPAAPGLRLLAIPEGHRMACRAPGPGETIAPTDQPLVQREFLFDPPSPDGLPPGFPILAPRTVIAVFDSAGSPVLLTDDVKLQPAGGEQVLVLFTGNVGAQGMRVRVDVDGARLAAAQAAMDLDGVRGALLPPVSREVTAAEVERVRALAAWLWERRCPGVAPGAGR